MWLSVPIERVLCTHRGRLPVCVDFYFTVTLLMGIILVHLCSVHGDSEQQKPLCLVNTSRRFCVFSVVFSSDGNEILGGANDGYLYIYDRNRNERTLCVSSIFGMNIHYGFTNLN